MGRLSQRKGANLLQIGADLGRIGAIYDPLVTRLFTNYADGLKREKASKSIKYRRILLNLFFYRGKTSWVSI